MELNQFIKYFNPNNYLLYIKKKTLMLQLKRVGKNFICDPNSSIDYPKYVEIGDNVFIGEQAHISAEVKIGNNIMFGPRPMIIGGNHYFAVKGRSVRFLHPKERENAEPIVVEDEVWCGASVLILGNVVLGMGCVIGAGSVVAKSIPPYTVALGNPCHPIKTIFSDNDLIEHLKQLGLTQGEALAIQSRRKSELKTWGIIDIPIVDKTNSYWEFRDV
jgi:acetyltransferase-like isoleucine patch superfamily enzyme